MSDICAFEYRPKQATDRGDRCVDYDQDCRDLDHLHCWLYDPTTGICPFLRGEVPAVRGDG